MGRTCGSPYDCDIGRTLLTELLHVCLDILDEPLEERAKIVKVALRNNETDLRNAVESYRWSLLNTGP